MRTVSGVFASAILFVGCGHATPQTLVQPMEAPRETTEQAVQVLRATTTTEMTLTAEQTAQLQAGAAPHKPTELTFNVTGGSLYFTPSVIRVKKGDKVKIVFTNAGGTHNFSLDEFQVKTPTVSTRESATVEFVVDKTGTFEYYCGVGRHRAMGQKGSLIVE